jgi:hypothetical protein
MDSPVKEVRRRTIKRFYIFLAANLALCVFIFEYLHNAMYLNREVLIGGNIASHNNTVILGLYFLFSVFFVGKFLQRSYARQYKYQSVIPLLKSIFKQGSYEADSGVSSNILKTSELFPYFDRMEGKDLITAQHKNTTFWASNLRLYQIRERDKKRYLHKFFDGIFLHLTFQKPFESTIVIKENRWVKILSSQSFFGKRLEKIKVIAPEFSKRYEAWGDDQVLSRKILQPELLEKIIKLSDTYAFILSINRNNVYMSIAKQRFRFNPRLFLFPPRSDDVREERIKKSLFVLRDIMDALRLETRTQRR